MHIWPLTFSQPTEINIKQKEYIIQNSINLFKNIIMGIIYACRHAIEFIYMPHRCRIIYHYIICSLMYQHERLAVNEN